MHQARVTPEAAAAERPSAGDPLEEAFARYQDELLGTLYYLVGNIEDARDALQDAFIKCWRHRAEVSGIDNLKAWIFRIALNTGRDVRSSAWRRRRQSLQDDAMETLADPREPADLERQEQLAQVRKALRQLRPEEQEVFLLRQNGQLSYEEIAQAAGIPLGTVKTRMRLALEKLRVAIQPC